MFGVRIVTSLKIQDLLLYFYYKNHDYYEDRLSNRKVLFIVFSLDVCKCSTYAKKRDVCVSKRANRGPYEPTMCQTTLKERVNRVEKDLL